MALFYSINAEGKYCFYNKIGKAKMPNKLWTSQGSTTPFTDCTCSSDYLFLSTCAKVAPEGVCEIFLCTKIYYGRCLQNSRYTIKSSLPAMQQQTAGIIWGYRMFQWTLRGSPLPDGQHCEYVELLFMIGYTTAFCEDASGKGDGRAGQTLAVAEDPMYEFIHMSSLLSVSSSKSKILVVRWLTPFV